MRIVWLCTALVLVLAVSHVRAEEKKKEQSEKLPKAVAAAVKEIFPGAKVVDVDKEDEDGKVLYEVKLRSGKGQVEVQFTSKGKVVKVEIEGGENAKEEKKSKNDKEEKDEGEKKSKKGKKDDDKGEKKSKKSDKKDDDKGEKQSKKKDKEDDDKGEKKSKKKDKED